MVSNWFLHDTHGLLITSQHVTSIARILYTSHRTEPRQQQQNVHTSRQPQNQNKPQQQQHYGKTEYEGKKWATFMKMMMMTVWSHQHQQHHTTPYCTLTVLWRSSQLATPQSVPPSPFSLSLSCTRVKSYKDPPPPSSLPFLLLPHPSTNPLPPVFISSFPPSLFLHHANLYFFLLFSALPLLSL